MIEASLAPASSESDSPCYPLRDDSCEYRVATSGVKWIGDEPLLSFSVRAIREAGHTASDDPIGPVERLERFLASLASAGGVRKSPNPASIDRAKKWVRYLYEEIDKIGLDWIPPHINIDEEGDVSFEWWHCHKKITVYVLPESTEFIKVWGPSTIEEMADGKADSASQRVDLWSWLLS